MIDVRGTLVVEKRMEGDLGRWVAGALGGIGLRDQEDPAAQHVGQQPQAQNERGEQLAAAHTRVGTPGRAHMRPVRKSTNVGRGVNSNHTTPAFRHTECHERTTNNTISHSARERAGRYQME